MDIAASRTSQIRSAGPQRGEKEDKGKTHSTQRSTRYKEKYQVMRERFDRVNAVRDAYLRDLELANEKIRKIQEENDLLLDAMLENPPLPLNPPAANPKRYQSPVPPHLVVSSQNYVPSHAPYQSGPPPPPASVYQYPPRSEHPDSAPPPPSHPQGYNYSHAQAPPRQYQYPPYGTNDGREGSGSSHHYPNARSRGPLNEHDNSHMDPTYTLQPAYPRIS